MQYRTHKFSCAAIPCKTLTRLIVADVPLCEYHRDRLAEKLVVQASVSSPDPAPAPPRAPLSPTADPAVVLTEYRSIVYYVTWDKGETVKIGTTTNPKDRFNSYFSRAGRPVDLLVAHPGSYDEESTMHRRFKHLRLPNERERFWQGPDLVDHIATVRAAWPNWKQIVNEVAWQRAGKRGRALYAVLNAK